MDNSTELYHEQFKSLSGAYTRCGGSIGNNEGLIDKHLVSLGNTLQAASKQEIATAVEYVKGEYIVCIFLLNSDRKRFGTLL